MSIKRFYQLKLALCLLLILAITFLLVSAYETNRQLTEAGNTRYQSYKLANEFKQSSDDLTQMARLYVVTRDPVYKQTHQSILDVRNGTAPRPRDGSYAYWDLIVASDGAIPEVELLPPISLKELTRSLNFHDDEMEKFEEAERLSNELTLTEQRAFYAIDGLFEDANGEFTRIDRPDQMEAFRLLFSRDYLDKKNQIIVPINELLGELDARTTDHFESVASQSFAYISIISLLAATLLMVFVVSGWKIFRQVINPIIALQNQGQQFSEDLADLALITNEIALGDHTRSFSPRTQPSGAKGKSEIEALNRQFDRMIGSLEDAGVAITQIIGNLGRRSSELLKVNRALEEESKVRKSSESRYRSLVMATSQIVWHTDGQGQVNGPLPNWQDFSGQSEAEVQGIGWANALHPDDIEQAVAVWTKSLETKSLYLSEYRIRRYDGVYRDFAVCGAPVLDAQGEICEWIGTCTDITDKKKAEIERDQFFTLSLDLLCVASTDGYFTRLNPAFESTLGFTQEELLSTPFMEFVHPEDLASTTQVMESLLDGEVLINFQNRYRCKDGTYRWFMWTCVPALGSNVLYAAARDITQIKQKEAEIRQLNVVLEQRVMERTSELQSSNQNLVQRTRQLEEVNKELEAFTYSVSHDLRAPLRGVAGYSRILTEDFSEVLGEEGNRLLGVVCGETRRMGQLIDDLLSFSRLGRQQLNKSDVDMRELAHEVLDGFSQELRDVIRQFDIGNLPVVSADRSMLRQVLVNLIGNAIKFTGQTAHPQIQVGHCLEQGDIVFFVKDNGAGFDPRYIDKLFGVFQRLHSANDFEGTGVGLALVQRIIHRHGGEVWAEGQPGLGATFYFSLPGKEGRSDE